jgi:hypothetical protein
VYESVVEKFERYVDKCEVENAATFNVDLATEARRRVQQLEFLYNKVQKQHDWYMELNWRERRRVESMRKQSGITSGSITLERSDESVVMESLIFEIETLTEAFYYLASRFRTILRKGPFPGLHSFECEGARNVRNHLLEHPEGGNSRIFAQSFGVGGEQGPTLKIERDAGQEHVFPDAGLWANAQEIKNNLEALLDRLLSS